MQSSLLGPDIDSLRAEGRESEALAYGAFNRALTLTSAQLLNLIEASRLEGKGGAGFPTDKKMRCVARSAASRKVLVVNGSEHEPGSQKDRFILQKFPHKVVEGALISAHAIGAGEIYFAVNCSALQARQSIEAHLLSAAQRFPGGSLRTQTKVKPVPDAYIVGEETALLEVIEGREPLPREKPPYPIEAGIDGMPTLVQNVETIAHIPYIVERGAQAYREAGSHGKGLTFCTLGDEFVNAGVHEVSLGTPLDEILYDLGGGLATGEPIKAIQPGGPSSAFLLPSQFHLPFESKTLMQHGSSLGCAVIRAFSESDCMVEKVGQIMKFFAHGSCGQCPSCRMETQMLTNIVGQVHAGKGSWSLLSRVSSVVDFAKDGGKCSLIKMPIPAINSGLSLFKEEFSAHIGKSCIRCGNEGTSV